DRGLVLGDDAVVPGVAGGLFRDHAETDGVVVPAGDERGAGRRTEGGRVHAGVAQAVLRHAVQRRRRDEAAERAGDAVARVVGHDQEDVGGPLGRHDARRPVGLRLRRGFLDLAAELRVGRRQLLAGDGCRGAGRTRRAGGLYAFAGRIGIL